MSTVDRLKSLRRTKLYDLLAALPLIAWFAFCGARIFPTLVQQFLLVKLFIQTDPTVLPISLVLSLASKLAYLAFVAMLIVFFAIRYIPQASASGLYPRFAALAGTFLSLGYVLLPPQEVFNTALRDLPTPNDRWFCAGNMGNVLARALDQHRTAGPAARYHGRLFLRAPSNLSW